MKQVIIERAQDPDYVMAPGGSTGLLVRREKVSRLVEYVFDKALVQAMLKRERQAAREFAAGTLWWSRRRTARSAPNRTPGGDLDVELLARLRVADLVVAREVLDGPFNSRAHGATMLMRGAPNLFPIRQPCSKECRLRLRPAASVLVTPSTTGWNSTNCLRSWSTLASVQTPERSCLAQTISSMPSKPMPPMI